MQIFQIQHEALSDNSNKVIIVSFSFVSIDLNTHIVLWALLTGDMYQRNVSIRSIPKFASVFQRRGRDATFCQITLKTRLFLFQSFNVYGSG